MALSTQSVAELAEQCIDRFDQTLEIPGLANNQWAENRRADFSLWVDGIGALGRQRASLEGRLESREDDLALIKTILLNLKSYLGRCLTAVEEELLREAKLDVDAAIDSLALIAVAIRRAVQRSRLSRADRFFDRTTLVELEMHLTAMVLLRRTSPNEEPSKHHEDDAPSVSIERLPEHLKRHKSSPVSWQSEIEGELTPLQDRLIKANLRRRNRFLYAQRRSKELAIPQAPAKKPVAIPPVPDREEVSSPNQIGVKHRQVPDNDMRETEKFLVSAPMSSTRASDIDNDLILEEPKSTFQAPKTQITSITGATERPKLRKPPAEKSGEGDIEQTKIQICPCCCEALPRGAVASKKAWRKHLSADVCPYTCISKDCPSPLVLYSTRAEWEAHMEKQHPKKWKCQLCDSAESSLFSSIDQLVEHVRQEHMDSLLEEDVEAVRLWPSTFTIGLDTCPLCRSAGPLDDPTLVDHVLEHTHEFALLSLPWADLPTETFLGLTTSDFYDLGCLKPAAPIFLSSLVTTPQSDSHSSEEHGLLHSNVEPSTTGEPALQTFQLLMLTWLDRRDMLGPEEREDLIAVLDKLKDSRTANSSSGKDDHSSRSPYLSKASTQDAQRDGSKSYKAWAESEPRIREIRDHGESLHYDDFPPQCRRIPDPEKWTQVDNLIREIGLELDAAKVRYQLDASKNFIPRSRFSKIMNPQKVLELVHGLDCFQDKSHEQKQQIAQDICFGSSNQRPSLKVLGALVASKQVRDLARHLQSGLTDGCLPLREDRDNKSYLCCQCSDRHHTAAINGLGPFPDDRKIFADWTRKLIAPYIRYRLGSHCHYIFENGVCLPIQSDEKVIPSQRNSEGQSGNGGYGGFSEVFRVKFYDCHCRFEDNGMRNSQGYYALKKLTSRNPKSFGLELSSLLFSKYEKRCTGHMVQVLTTFEEVNPTDHQSTYYMLFDWAEGDLQYFWQSNKSLVHDKSHCLWMAEQFLGLGSALESLHIDRQHFPMPYDAVELENCYDRHGDIKPSNILLFQPRGAKPFLALGGFGLGKLHTKVSRSRQDPKLLGQTGKYRSPEFDLPDGLVGPRSDVYSLGCVFLEYITWFLCGPVLDRFSEDRTEKDIYGFYADTFFTFEGNEGKSAVIKPAVERWIESLREKEACSRYLFEMLDLIETKMMQVDKEKRIRATPLVKRLTTLKMACQHSRTFYMKNWKTVEFQTD